jgi:hypothetical protein
MTLSETELAEPAVSRFAISVIGGDAVFLVDRMLGHKLYLGYEKRLSPPELRRYAASLNHDLKSLSTGDFFAKHGLRG